MEKIFSSRGRNIFLAWEKKLLILLLCLPALPAWSQGFTLRGTAPQGTTGMAVLTFYVPEGQQVKKSRVRKGAFSFEGTLSAPTVAMLRIGGGAPLYLWMENAEVTLAYNPAAPMTSRVSGSRSNSEYRYAMELCAQDAASRGGDSPLSQALLRYAGGHLASRYVPFMLWLSYQGEDYAALDTLCRHLAGDAVQAYHYPLLQRKAVAMRDSREGCRAPAVTLPVGAGRRVPLDSLCRLSPFTFLLVSPAWLEEEQHVGDSLRAAIRRSGRPAQVAWVVQDREEAAWDAPYMQQLNVQRLPYVILLDATGRIVARDVRVWEAERLLRNLPAEPADGQSAGKKVPAGPPAAVRPAVPEGKPAPEGGPSVAP